jgi:photosystem I P700 chlorophyll a apoprotein A1
MYFHGARFSNSSAWLSSLMTIAPSSQVVWPVVGQEILNGDVGEVFLVYRLHLVFFRCGVHRESQIKQSYTGQLWAV